MSYRRIAARSCAAPLLTRRAGPRLARAHGLELRRDREPEKQRQRGQRRPQQQADHSRERAVGLAESLAELQIEGITLAAGVETDVDGDGFGDETQDQFPTDASAQGQCPDTAPPDTTITKKPKDKTKSKTASFEFSSSQPGSTFECKLDDAAFVPCSSPRVEKVKKGKHTFQVRAKGPAGNVDPSPAVNDWKVKKKKKAG